MARRRKDGAAARPANKRRLTQANVDNEKPGDRLKRTWDLGCRRLALFVYPSGKKAFKLTYRFGGEQVWVHLGDAMVISLVDAREKAQEITNAVARGQDPRAAKKAERAFADIAERYVEERAKLRNKTWQQAAYLVTKHLVPPWGALPIQKITRADVKAVMATLPPILANRVRAHASAIFTWAIREEIIRDNPCKLIEDNPTTARSRVLDDGELKLVWPELPPELQFILLCGQRPCEVAGILAENIDADGWWLMPGRKEGAWQGTKNGRDHRIPLSEHARALVPRLLAEKVGPKSSARRMRKIVAATGIKRATPHDLRRTFLTFVTRLGFGRDAMDRIANHKTSKVTDVYDRHGYQEEDRAIMAAVAAKIMSIVEPHAPTSTHAELQPTVPA